MGDGGGARGGAGGVTVSMALCHTPHMQDLLDSAAASGGGQGRPLTSGETEAS